MNTIIYLVAVVVIVVAIPSFVGLREPPWPALLSLRQIFSEDEQVRTTRAMRGIAA
jgi:hypothetical protein